MNNTVTNKTSVFLIYPIDEDVCVLNSDGYCVASSDSKKVGAVFDITNNKALKKTYLRDDGQEKIIILYENNKYSPKELKFIKSLAKMTLQQYIDNATAPQNSIDQFVGKIINTPMSGEKIPALEKEAETLGVNVGQHFIAVIIEINNFTKDHLLPSISLNYSHADVINDWRQKIAQAFSGFFTTNTNIIVAYLGKDRFICFKEVGLQEEKFRRLLKSAYRSIFSPLLNSTADNLLVAYSSSHTGIAGLHDSYHEALQALEIGQKIDGQKNQSYFYGDLGTLRILMEKDVQKKKNFANEVLDPLEKQTFRITLEVFLNENMDIKKTAGKLRVHPNTVNYRLGRIAEELNLDPRVFTQAFELRIALLTDQLFN